MDKRARLRERLRELQAWLARPERVRLSGASRREMDAAREARDIRETLELIAYSKGVSCER